MKTIIEFIRPLLLSAFVLSNLVVSTFAQEVSVSIPDPGLNAAIRAALQKPNGPLTEQDLLSLTNLDASSRDVSSVVGLEAARNLERLFLDSNGLTNFSLPGTLTNLIELHLSFNSLTNVSLPNGLTTLATLQIEGNQLTSLTLPENLTALVKLDLGDNRLTRFTLPAGLTSLFSLNVAENQLTSFALPAGMTNLGGLFLFANQLTNVTLPADLTKLAVLDLDRNQLTGFVVPTDMTDLSSLTIQDNALTSFTLPAGLTALTNLNLAGNQLSSFTVQLSSLELPSGLTALASLDLSNNQLTDLTLPLDMTNLTTLLLDGNPLRSLTLSQQLATTNLAALVASLSNQGISLLILQATTNPPPTVGISSPTNGASFTAPATITIQATARDSDGSVTNVQFFDGDTSLGNVSSSPYNLSVSLAVGSHTLTAVASDNLGNTTTSLAVTVTVTTNSPPTVTEIVISGTTRLPDGAFQFAFTNTPGASFTVLTSTDFALPVEEWTSAGAALETSPGNYQFTDATPTSPLRFYRVRSP